MMDKVAIILPARNERFLQPTIDHLLKSAVGEIQIIAVLDDYWPNPPIEDHPDVDIIHLGQRRGMRPAIMAGVAATNAKYIMKLDAHCLMDEGFDIKLQQDIEYDWIVVPRRYPLDIDNWKRIEWKIFDHLYLTKPSDTEPGYQGKWWRERGEARKNILIDDLMTFQGSCWFCHRDYFWEFGGFDLGYGHFYHEAQEIGFRTWLSGGRVVRNKKTWYAHLHKGTRFGRGYSLRKGIQEQGRDYLRKVWVDGDNGPKQKYPLQWLIDKFMPMPGW